MEDLFGQKSKDGAENRGPESSLGNSLQRQYLVDYWLERQLLNGQKIIRMERLEQIWNNSKSDMVKEDDEIREMLGELGPTRRINALA
ncbi:uncharacterized protein PGTG_21589 [Puccinia graminis f. sp. tritici CRL 75-36-700-3]|uniref:Uncharacterized protein n=1 Tax=Puccinia graminis f. sp. tritici (strain CRL 75-36-700-3 / race SCCL) TaxID=418459 RepID=H6QRX4_PUCGT|nr:uncharacterized protein PGTG_21589 [Puccinia graminis f. sp. tritici CRL 75-36-700-3]EHS63458.1 hypothetical protein PGTG_21589 [Puccinia graminis f. sp. tritici CRL 75-36-700-3]